MKVRVSDFIANHLEKIGVRRVFLLAGGGMMHLLDSISRCDQLKYICNHHEQASAMAAEGYARQMGSLGVCYATSGPGGVNTLNGIVGAWVDSSPVLVVTGQSKLSQTIRHTGLTGLRQFGTFEVDIVAMAQPITKYAVFLNDAKKVRYELEKAIHLACSGRPGPVLIDIPVDIQGSLIEPSELEGFTPDEAPGKLKPSQEEVASVLERLKNAKRPLILAGHGVRVSQAGELFKDCVRKLNIPVATTPLAADLMEYEDDLYVGHPGMKGDRPGNFAVQTADVILTLGSSLHVLTTGYELKEFAPNAYKIQVDLDEWVMKREEVGVHQKISAGVKEFLEVTHEILSQSLKSPTWASPSAWHQRCISWKRELSSRHEKHKRIGDQINYYDLNEVLSDLSKPGDTIVADAGSAFYVIGQAFRTKKDQRVIISGGLGTMGFALPAASGAASATSQGTVICVTGDGSLQTNVHELGVIQHNQLNVKLFVPSNGGYVSIRNTQNNFFGGHLAGTSEGSGVSFPSLEKLAAAYNLPYISARTVSELKEVVAKTLNHSGPIICEIFTPPEQEIIPTVSSMRLANGAMKSKPLHDMYPFMDEQTLESYLKV
jgi:acetolactate synthase I/II/III large subunit